MIKRIPMTVREMRQKNLIIAIELGIIDWFQFFEGWSGSMRKKQKRGYVVYKGRKFYIESDPDFVDYHTKKTRRKRE